MLTRHTPQHRFSPRMDVLEDRTVPACSVTQSGTLLQITGDASANTVLIQDAGTGSVQVTCDGVLQTFSGVQGIRVQTLDGNDTVIYTLAGDMAAGQNHSLNIALGDGNDFFLAQSLDLGGGMSADLTASTSLVIFVFGEDGRDTMGFDFTKDFDINTGAQFYVAAVGNQERDVITMAQLGDLDGTANLNAYGKKGDDGISIVAAIDSNATGSLAGLISGEGGDDDMTFVVSRSRGFTGTVTGSADGGGGTNFATVSNFVLVSDVEDDNLVRYPF